jgi:hypothetical protein
VGLGKAICQRTTISSKAKTTAEILDCKGRSPE